MKRRILSVLLAALLLLPSALTAAATAPVTITSQDVRGNVGDTVTATLNIAIDPPKLGQAMDSLQFVLEYDSAALEFVGIQELNQDRINILGAQYVCNVTTKSGAVAFSAAATDGAYGTGVLMHVRFKILSAFSTILVLKKVSYSFVNSKGTSQDRRQGGTINLGRITGSSVPTTIEPATYAPLMTPEPWSTPVPTDAPRFPVTETTMFPGVAATPEPEQGESDILAYIVFGLFIVVAILICVVLTLMIVRRGQKARAKFLEDEEPEAYEDQDDYYEEPEAYEEEEEEPPPIKIVRRGKK